MKFDTLIIKLQDNGSYDWSVVLLDVVKTAFGDRPIASGTLSSEQAKKMGVDLSVLIDTAMQATLAQVSDLKTALDNLDREAASDRASAKADLDAANATIADFQAKASVLINAHNVAASALASAAEQVSKPANQGA